MSDTSTTESIIKTAYAMLSGRASDKRDWDRWRSLHDPGARLIPLEKNVDGKLVARVMTPDEYIASRTPFFSQNDFFEYETARVEHRCGALAHVWSSYEGSPEPGGKVIRRGVNSIQLWHDGSRWWILSIAWDAVDAIAQAD